MAVTGPNGCGKTTLVKSILGNMGLRAKGTVRIKGRAVSEMDRKTLARQMAAVFQTLDPAAMTVSEYVALGRLPHFGQYQFHETRKDLAVAEKYMDLTGIQALAGSRITEISGGERQVCAIARALTQEPALLVLDEPTSHLDISRQAGILDLLTRLKQQLSLAVLVVLHDLNLASEYADRILLLDGETGRIFHKGPPRKVLTQSAVEKVYKARIRVFPNPVTGKPWIIPLSNLSSRMMNP